MLGAKPLFINNSAFGGLPPARTSIRCKRSINPVRPEGVALQDAEPGEQFHGSSAS
jgi:hypothetical protein